MKKYQRYIKDITSGKVNHGKYVRLTIERHLKESEFIFNEEIADRYIRFIENLQFTQGKWAGNKFELEDWQAFFIASIFGWQTKEGKRRFKQVTLNVPKKNGKSELGAAISLACAVLDNEARGQIFMAATTQDQAAICFEAAKAIVRAIPALASRFTQRQHRLICNKNQTYIRYISSEADATEGKGASVVIYDEEHAQQTNELRDNLKTGMGAREQPLFISISTAGTDKNCPYFKHLATCRNILDGVLEDENHFVLMYVADGVNGSVDWENPQTWKQANPNWGVSVLEDNFKAEYTEAKNEPSKQPNFITKKLNIWADSSSTWIDAKRWAGMGGKLDLKEYEGKIAYLGLDLGRTGDLSALSIILPEGDKITLFTKFYMPDLTASNRTKADKINYKQWIRSGWITETEGDATDDTVILNDIVHLSGLLKVNAVGYDPAYATLLSNTLYNSYGVRTIPIRQGIFSLAEPTRHFNNLILKGDITHEMNPVYAWMMANVQIDSGDRNDNIYIHKAKSRGKVDGPTSTVTAIAAYLDDVKAGKLVTQYVW